MLSDCTVVVGGASVTVFDIRQIELCHRDVFVFLDRVVVARPDIDHLVFRVAIYKTPFCLRHLSHIVLNSLPAPATPHVYNMYIKIISMCLVGRKCRIFIQQHLSISTRICIYYRQFRKLKLTLDNG